MSNTALKTSIEAKDQDVKKVPVEIKVNVTLKDGWSHKTALKIRDVLFSCINKSQRVGEQLENKTFHEVLKNINGFSVNQVYLTRKGCDTVEPILRVNYNEQVCIDINDIKVVMS